MGKIYNFIESYIQIHENIHQNKLTPHESNRIRIFDSMANLSQIEANMKTDGVNVAQELIILRNKIDFILANEFPALNNKIQRNGMRNSGHRNKNR
jgi:NAD(P)H-hydrate repair Nnr-like enzyme with NAD(P)H-hydrate dehydratase domain